MVIRLNWIIEDPLELSQQGLIQSKYNAQSISYCSNMVNSFLYRRLCHIYLHNFGKIIRFIWVQQKCPRIAPFRRAVRGSHIFVRTLVIIYNIFKSLLLIGLISFHFICICDLNNRGRQILLDPNILPFVDVFAASFTQTGHAKSCTAILCKLGMRHGAQGTNVDANTA